ncbi:MAG: exo-alpha-sialidase [Bacteroidota bacterium]
MKNLIALFLVVGMLTGCNRSGKESALLIGMGQMPNAVKDGSGNLHIVFGSKDSIMYSVSSDNGKSFSAPALIGGIPHLAASHMRGPQIAVTSNGVTVIASNRDGDIFSFNSGGNGRWLQTARVNDVDTVAKEGLMALSGEGQNTFAVWLDLRDHHNKIFGSNSADGGKTWSANKMIYASPDTTVCECCKPSVVIKGKDVYVMFRNWLKGNRDLHLIHSVDGGNSFGEAQKLGNGSWQLNGCPMDGGGLTLDANGCPKTVWQRKGVIYASEPGKDEKEIAKGRGCTLASVNGKTVYAWTDNGEVYIQKPQGMKISLGKGSLPIIKPVNNEHVLCVWENEKKVYAQVVEL